ncbi:hypothetical protein LZ554_009254 [Drepanopeziza brunnea f. sp. 'monogermtubi']|nr:hypothetical protein LZ554_009254 [Drepanopeziza brunnea f. sp. 'monogermtubi']
MSISNTAPTPPAPPLDTETMVFPADTKAGAEATSPTSIHGSSQSSASHRPSQSNADDPDDHDPHASKTLWQCVSLYRPSILWSMIFSASLVMEGYSLALVPSLFAQPSFQQKFGEPLPAPQLGYDVSAGWKTALNVGPIIGELIGLFLNGICCDRYGYKKTMFVFMGFMAGFNLITFFAGDVKVLFASQLLSGVPWGVFQAMAPAYSSEICHTSIRPYVTNFVNFCWLFGQLAASIVLRCFVNYDGQWAYRIPFAIQWAFPIPIMVLVIFAPESPWFLLRQNRDPDAVKSLRRLASKEYTTADAQRTLEFYKRTDEIERLASAGTAYKDCFTGADCRRTEIAAMVWIAQSLVGSALMASSTYFYTQAGVDTKTAYNLTLGGYGAGMAGTMASWIITGYVGRRKLYLGGSGILGLLLFTIGCTAFSNSKAGHWATCTLLIAYTLVYNLTIGPTCYTLISEISSTRLKAKTVVIARGWYNVGAILVNILANYQLTPKASGGWGWAAKTGFFYAGTCLLMVVWQFFRLPEPKDRDYAELDILFEHRISARKFARTTVDVSKNAIVPGQRRSSRKKDRSSEQPVEPVELEDVDKNVAVSSSG